MDCFLTVSDSGQVNSRLISALRISLQYVHIYYLLMMLIKLSTERLLNKILVTFNENINIFKSKSAVIISVT